MGGYTVEESLNKNFLVFIHPDDRALLRQRGLMAQREGKINQLRYEVRIIRKDRGERWLDFSPSLITYNGMPALIGTAIDITERKQAEIALRDALLRGKSFSPGNGKCVRLHLHEGSSVPLHLRE